MSVNSTTKSITTGASSGIPVTTHTNNTKHRQSLTMCTNAFTDSALRVELMLADMTPQSLRDSSSTSSDSPNSRPTFTPPSDMSQNRTIASFDFSSVGTLVNAKRAHDDKETAAQEPSANNTQSVATAAAVSVAAAPTLATRASAVVEVANAAQAAAPANDAPTASSPSAEVLNPNQFYSVDSSLPARLSEEKYVKLLKAMSNLAPTLESLNKLAPKVFGNPSETIQKLFQNIHNDHNSAGHHKALYWGGGLSVLALSAGVPCYLGAEAIKTAAAITFGAGLADKIIGVSATKMAVTKSTIQTRYVKECTNIRTKMIEYGKKLIDLYVQSKFYVASEGVENSAAQVARAKHNVNVLVLLALKLFKNQNNIKTILRLLSTFPDQIKQNDFAIEVGLTGKEMDPILVPLHNALSNILRDANKDKLPVLNDSGIASLDLSLQEESGEKQVAVQAEPDRKSNAANEIDRKAMDELVADHADANQSDDEMTQYFIERTALFSAHFTEQKAREVRRKKHELEAAQKEQALREETGKMNANLMLLVRAQNEEIRQLRESAKAQTKLIKSLSIHVSEPNKTMKRSGFKEIPMGIIVSDSSTIMDKTDKLLAEPFVAKPSKPAATASTAPIAASTILVVAKS